MQGTGIRLLLADVDGIPGVTGQVDKVLAGKVLTDRAVDAVRRLGEAGIMLAITSSRPPRVDWWPTGGRFEHQGGNTVTPTGHVRTAAEKLTAICLLVASVGQAGRLPGPLTTSSATGVPITRVPESGAG